MNIEAKAKRYVLEQLEENGYRNFHGGEWVEDAFTAGYTQAVTDLSAENEKLREALREIINECEEWVITGAETSNNCEGNHYVEIDDLKSLIEKAKQLITEP